LDNERQARERPAPRFEPEDVPAFLPLWLGGSLAGFVAVVLIVITVAFPLADRQEARGPLQPLPPAPQLQTAPGQDLARYRAAKSKEVDEQAIQAAMNATARQGWGPSK
jgi:hypothetical protein